MFTCGATCVFIVVTHRRQHVTRTVADNSVDRAVRACPERVLVSVRPSPAPAPSAAHPRIHPPTLRPPSFRPVPLVVTSVAADLVASRDDPTLVTHVLASAVATPRNDSTGGHEGVDVFAKPDANAHSETPIPPAPSHSSLVVVGASAKRVAKERSTASTPPRHSWSFASSCAARDAFTYKYMVDATWIPLDSPGMGPHTPIT